MGITDRKLRQKEEVRASILDTAWELVVSEGWQSFSIRKIADAIEYSVPVIYSHFENKDAILLEFNRKGFALLIKKLKEAKAGKQSPGEEIFAMGHAYWSFAFLNREYYQLMFGLGIPTCEAVRRIPEMVDFNATITDSITALIPPEKQPAVDPFLKFQSFWSMMHGLVSINMLNKSVANGYNAAAKEQDQHPGIETNGHNKLAEQVLNDVICSFIKGIIS